MTPPERPEPAGAASELTFRIAASARLAHLAWAAALCAGLAAGGCAGGGPWSGVTGGPGTARTPAGQVLLPEQAQAAVEAGTSSRADVAAALGPARVVRFDSGYEVWLYRWPGRQESAWAQTELVLLFPPAGPLAKKRLRPGVAPP